jgi:hypothetical protein
MAWDTGASWRVVSLWSALIGLHARGPDPLSCPPSLLQTGPPSLPRGVALTALVPLPALKTQCGKGFGLAAWPGLGLLVTSEGDKNTLSVWGLPGGASGGVGASGGAGACARAGARGASAGW